jgi:hypothetical protein
MTGNNSLLAGTARGPYSEMKLGAFESSLGKLGLLAQTGAVSLQLAANSRATGFSGLIHAKQTLPEVQIHLGAASAELSRASLDVRRNTQQPKLSLKVCGRSTARDANQLKAAATAAERTAAGDKDQAGRSEPKLAPDPAQAEQALVELAVERMRVVRRYLIREQGADAKRIPECRSTFEPTDQGSPRVEIKL